MYCEWHSVCDFVVLLAGDVCVDYDGVNVYHVCLDFSVVYGIKVCINGYIIHCFFLPFGY